MRKEGQSKSLTRLDVLGQRLRLTSDADGEREDCWKTPQKGLTAPEEHATPEEAAEEGRRRAPEEEEQEGVAHGEVCPPPDEHRPPLLLMALLQLTLSSLR